MTKTTANILTCRRVLAVGALHDIHSSTRGRAVSDQLQGLLLSFRELAFDDTTILSRAPVLLLRRPVPKMVESSKLPSPELVAMSLKICAAEGRVLRGWSTVAPVLFISSLRAAELRDSSGGPAGKVRRRQSIYTYNI